MTRSRREQADAHRVDEAVAGVGLVEDRLAADGRHADAVAVVADARDRAPEAPVGRAEAQPVEQRDRPRAHRDDVAQDPADPGGRALERLDRDGWLWLSTLNATASPSPRSITPAFSPGPCSTRSPALGSRFSSRAECL